MKPRTEHSVAAPLVEFLELRTATAGARIGDGGPDTCAALSDGLDTALRELSEGMGPGAALVALGGYGRGEQCIWSDVDVMVLYSGDEPERHVRAVLYPLWDAGLKVGHAVRTVAHCRSAAKEEFDTLTSLLSARLIAGDETLFGELIDTVTDLIRTRPLSPGLVARERERRARDPFQTMTADVKESRGALRTHHGFWWERRRAELLGRPVDAATPTELEARTVLLSIRNALHAAAGRASDRFLVDLREPAARWLGTEVHLLAARYTAALHEGDRLADRRWPDLHSEQDPMIGLGRRVFAAIRSRFTQPPEEVRAPEGVLGLAVAAAGRESGAWFSDDEEEAVRAAARCDWTAADRAAFVTLLGAGARGMTIFGRLEELGWLRREFPEWAPVATAPQLAPFHDHPVGAHLWRTVREMQTLIADGGEPGVIAEEVGSTEELLLAAFFHDIGKARGGNHAEKGAELAAAFLRRTHFGPATIAVVSAAIRHHLLLSETATRRDLADLRVIDGIADEVGDSRQLQVLYLLTIADLRATGTTMWNGWRAALLQELYRKVGGALEAGGAAPATPHLDAVLDAAPAGTDRRAVEEHVAAMSPDYLDTTTPGEVLWHLEVAADLEGPALIAADSEDSGRVLVAGEDRMGFLLAVSRAFTANGVGILDARLRTRADGIALDTFHITDDRTGAVIAPARLQKVATDLRATLAGELDLRPAIRERVAAYRRASGESGTVQVRPRVAGRFTSVEVRAPDRVGLLTSIVEALHGEGLDIHLARIDTMGSEARDVFYVRWIGGTPIRADAELTALGKRLEDRLRG
jgi:[protein-PII] uridylyltransferase